MLRQTGPKPKCDKASKRKDHETESKALEISSFRNMLGTFLPEKNLDSLLHQHIIIMNTSAADESTLVGGHQRIQKWGKSICQNLCNQLGETMD